jgi:hypothetical protein
MPVTQDDISICLMFDDYAGASICTIDPDCDGFGNIAGVGDEYSPQHVAGKCPRSHDCDGIDHLSRKIIFELVLTQLFAQ